MCRKAALCLVFLLCLTLLPGCAPEARRAPIPDAPVDLIPTDELTVYYAPGFYSQDLSILAGVRLFRQFYPEVKVTAKAIPWEEYGGTLQAELMAGAGPDLIQIHPGFFSDLYKTMDSGAFLNLDPILEQDLDFHLEDYVQPVMDGGVYRGGRYLMPISYRLYHWVTTDEFMQRVGFDPAAMESLSSMAGELERLIPVFEEQDVIPLLNYSIFQDYLASGLELIDHDTGAVFPDERGLTRFLEAMKSFTKMYDQCVKETKYQSEQVFTPQRREDFYRSGKAGEFLFGYNELTADFFSELISLRALGTAQSYPFLSCDGKRYAYPQATLAISSTSKNQLNAWNFIKLMLSENYQSSQADFLYYSDYPVRIASLTASLDYVLTFAQEGSPWAGQAARLSAQDREAILQEVQTPDGCYLPQRQPLYILWEEMTPYFEDRESRESCLARARQRISLYASE